MLAWGILSVTAVIMFGNVQRATNIYVISDIWDFPMNSFMDEKKKARGLLNPSGNVAIWDQTCILKNFTFPVSEYFLIIRMLFE